MPSPAPVVAVLGTGTIGAAMAANIAASGLDLQVWNRDPDRAAPLADVGATVSKTPADAARGAGLQLGIAESVRARLQLAADSGLGHSDVAATYRLFYRAPGA